jgi:DNA-binding NarL/FixJ family response regulator
LHCIEHNCNTTKFMSLGEFLSFYAGAIAIFNLSVASGDVMNLTSAKLCAAGNPCQKGQIVSSLFPPSCAASANGGGRSALPGGEPIREQGDVTAGEQDTLPERPDAARDRTASEVIRIMIVDEDPIMRSRLRAILKQYQDLEVVGDTGDSAAATALAHSLSPNVALVEIHIAGQDGFEAASRIRDASPATRIAMIGDRFDAQSLDKGLAVAVHGFILKLESHDRLAAFVRAITRGAFCCSESVREALHFRLASTKVARREDPRLQLLTAVEREMLVELAKGNSLKDVARTLRIRYKTADHLKQSVMKKLDIHDRVEIARYAIREGLIT